MPNACVKLWENLRKAAGKTCWYLSPAFHHGFVLANNTCEQADFIPTFTRTFPPTLSTRKIAVSPLVEQKFYPVSTGPIISITN